jgi:AraC-like DNA-binding protein
VGQIAVLSGSIREAMTLLARYQSLLLEGARFELVEQGDDACFVYAHAALPPDLGACEAEGLLVLVLDLGKRFVADRPARCVRFAHPCRGHLAEYHRAFGCEVQFGATAHQIVFARESLDVQHMHRDAALCALLCSHADRWLALRHSEARFPQRVRDVLCGEVARGPVRVSAVARRLGMSPRALQRRLQDHGLCLSALVDQARRDAARRALEDPRMALKEVSDLLGFSEPSAFHRAFKRWTGLTPQQYRDSLAVPTLPVG